MLGLLIALGPAPTAAQQVALIHPAGDGIRVGGMNLREYASELQMNVVDGESDRLPDTCFVALVDSRGVVWEEWASERFRSEAGELDGACVPRFPMLPGGQFPEVSVMVPMETGVGAEVFFGGMVDWELFMGTLQRSGTDVFEGWPSKWYNPGAEGETLRPPQHVEGSDYDWVSLVFMVGPSEEMAGQLGLGFATRPIMILVGGR